MGKKKIELKKVIPNPKKLALFRANFAALKFESSALFKDLLLDRIQCQIGVETTLAIADNFRIR